MCRVLCVVMRRVAHVCCVCVLMLCSTQAFSCNKDLKVKSFKTNLTSPGYPKGYERPTECWWRLAAGADDVVHVHVDDVDLDPYPPGLYRHRVVLYDGYNDRLTAILGEVDVNSTSLTSSGRYLYVVFIASRLGSEGEHRGFLVQYWAEPADLTRCEFNLTANTEHKYLISPGYPGGYANNVNCTWVIWAETGYIDYVVRIEVLGSELENNCAYDNVSVYDGPTRTHRRLGVWCGVNSPVFEGSQDSMLLWFRTDSSSTKRGFQLKYYILIEGTINETCGRNLIASSSGGLIISPGHPNRYPSNMYCWWRITTEDSKAKVRLEVLNSNIESSYHCMADSVEVYDGPDNSTKRLGSFCGGQTPTYESKGQTMFVEFITNLNINDNGFRLKYSESRSCTPGYTEDLYADSQFRYLESPNYPQYYPNNFECGWRINVNVSYFVELVALTFKLERTDGCSYDYLEVRDGDSKKARLLGRFCGLSKPILFSSGLHLYLHFKSDGSHSDAGFRFQYRATDTKQADDTRTVYLTTVMVSTTSLLVFIAVALILVFCIIKLKQKHRRARRHQAPSRTGNTGEETRTGSPYSRQESELFHIQPNSFVVSPPPYHLVVSDTRYALPLDDPPPYPAAEFELVDKYQWTATAGLIKMAGSDTTQSSVRDSREIRHEHIALSLGDGNLLNTTSENSAPVAPFVERNRTSMLSDECDVTQSVTPREGAVSDSRQIQVLDQPGSATVNARGREDIPVDQDRYQSRDDTSHIAIGDTTSVPAGCIETSV
ncbi:bone morphogenetic protein 1-like [Gigantopelta aegis]|uniref:bone morphogenetic protein 1-like n=1 Tax=Gigantopelta aegis TaxID=1735272 RepID=UPI001B88D3F6|nr:bone morphogenetic protein 1-like [Gigantopelta aegis]